MKTLTLIEAADFLKMHREEVRSRAKSGLIPAAKPGKCWVFLLDDLVDYLRNHYAVSWQALRVTRQRKEESECHSLNVVKRGGLTSLHCQVSELDVLLEQPIKSRQKSSMTG
jgi:hypothetical protein